MPTKSASLVGVASSAGVPSPIWPERRHRTGVDDALGAGARGGTNHRHGTVHVGAQHASGSGTQNR